MAPCNHRISISATREARLRSHELFSSAVPEAFIILTASFVNLFSLLSASSAPSLLINFLKKFLRGPAEPLSTTRTGNIQSGTNSLARLSFVIIAKISSNSAIIFTTTSLTASVVGTSAYSSSGLKKPSIRSKMTMSVSWLTITSSAACVGSISDCSGRGRSRTIVSERRTPAPAKMIFAGENN